MALPSKVNFVTFDVYGTLIDWEKGVFDAFQKEATRDGFTIEDPQEVISRFHEYEREIEGGSYELYAEVLRRVAVRIAKDIGWPLEPSRAGFLPDSVAALGAVQGDQPAADEVLQEVPDRAHLEHRRQAPGPDAPPPAARLRPRRHRPAGALLQARPGALQGVRAAHRHQEGLGPRRGQLLPRRRAVPEGEGPGHLGQPQQGGARRRARRSPRPRSRPSSRRPSCSARRSGGRAAVRVVSPARRRPRRHLAGCGRRPAPRCAPARRAFVDRLADLPRRARRRCRPCSSRPASRSAACWPPTATGTTCSAALAFPGAALGVAETTAAHLTGEPGAAQRELRAWDEEHYVERPRPLSLGQVQALPVPGHSASASTSSSCIPPTATPPTGWRSGRRGRACCVCGDYLSPVEIPTLSAHAARATPTWRRSSACARSSTQADWVVPGHGAPIDGARALAILRRGRALPDRLGAAARAAHRRAARGRRRQLEERAGQRDPPRRAGDAPARTSRASWRSGRCSASSASTRRATSRDRSAWVQRAGTQVHLLYADDPSSPPRGPRRGRRRRLRRDRRAPGARRLRVPAATQHWGARALRRVAGRPPRRGHGLPAARS